MAILQHRLEEIAAGGVTPGLAVIVGSSTDILESAATGVRRIGHPQSLTIDDPVHIGSCTKGLTATMIGTLVEDRLVEWTTPIGAIYGDSAYAAATVEQLLRHEAGLPPFEEDEEFEVLPELPEEPSAHRRAFSEAVLQLDPAYPVGTGFSYSNAGFCVATSIVEELTGSSWERLLRDRIFEPLELEAGFGWPAAAQAGAPWGHIESDDGPAPHDPTDDYQLEPSIAPAGDVHMPLMEFTRWLQMNCRGLRGAETVVSTTTLRYIHTATGRAGLGWGVGERNGMQYSVHTGSAGTFFVVGAVVPDRNRVLALATNAGYATAEQATLPLVREYLQSWADGS